MTDPGAPATQVANGTPQPHVAIRGYSVIEADDVDGAVAALKSQPCVARGGTLQVDGHV